MTEGLQAPAGAIYDRGYRHYDGVREGRSRLVKALVLAGVRRTLGLRRSWRTKIVPWGLLVIAFAPVVAFIGIRVVAGGAVEQLIGYGRYLRIVSAVLLLFSATAAPELLCPDRQSNVLALYFTRPLSRPDYLLAKAAALLLVMALIALLPLVVLFVGNTLTAPHVVDYLGDHVGDIGRILLTGTMLTVFYSSVALAIASLTERRSIAVAVLLGSFLVSNVVVGVIVFATDFTGRRWVTLLALPHLVDRFVDWVFGEPVAVGSIAAQAGFSGPVYLVALLVATALAATLLSWRISRLRA
ncbi:MAG TPA: ABC transporter permease [Actinomycetes bacterium]|nr:ABC transporter permease [Actinomycetes bacterium]